MSIEIKYQDEYEDEQDERHATMFAFGLMLIALMLTGVLYATCKC